MALVLNSWLTIKAAVRYSLECRCVRCGEYTGTGVPQWWAACVLVVIVIDYDFFVILVIKG